MKAQVTGNSISITLHLLLVAAFLTFNTQMQTPVAPLLLDLHVLQGMEEQAPGPPAAENPAPPAAPQPAPEPQEAPPESVSRPVALKPVIRKKIVQQKTEPQKLPDKQQTQARPEPSPAAPAISSRANTTQAANPAAATGQELATKEAGASAGRSGQRQGVYRPGEIDGSLTALKRTEPIYPASARRRNIEGWVQVQFVVNEHGRPEQIQVLSAKPKDIFDRSVVESIKRWRFRPGTVNGAAVRVLVEQTIRFQLH